MQQMLSALDYLSQYGKKLGAVAGSATLYESIFDFFAAAFECDEATVYLSDASQSAFIFAAKRSGDRETNKGEALQRGQGLKGRAVETGSTQFAVDTILSKNDESELGGAVSEAAIPLRHGDEVIGVIDVISRTRKFKETDLLVFNVFGELVAAAISKLRLRETLSDRTRKLSYITKAGQVFTTEISIDEHLRRILSCVKDALSPEGCSIRLLDKDGAHLISAAAIGCDEKKAAVKIPSNKGLWGFALSTGRPSLLPPPPETVPPLPPGTDGYLSEMAVPMLFRGDPLGVLHLFHSKKGVFTDTDLLYASVFADMAADAVKLSGLNSIDPSPSNLKLFADTAAVISHTEDFGALFNEIFDRVAQPLGFLRAEVLLPEPSGQALAARYARGVGGAPAGTRLPIDTGAVGQCFRTLETVFAAPAPQDPEATAQIASAMKVGENLVGVLSVIPKGEANEFQISAAELLAAQLASAMKNCRMIRRLESSCRRLDSLNQAAFALNATLSLDSLLEKILSLAIKALHLERCAVLLLEEDEKTLSLVAAVGYGAVIGKKISVGQGITGTAAARAEFLYAEDTERDTRYLESGIKGRSEMAAPLVVHGKVIGVLDTESLHPNRFSARDMELFSAFAAQAATAVHNARLFENLEAANLTLEENVKEVSRLNAELGEYSKRIYRINESLEFQLKNLTTIHEAGKTITSSLDLDATLSAILDMTSQIIGSTAGAIKLLDEESKEFRTRAQSGSLTDVSSSCTILEVPLLIGDKKIGIFELICKAHNGVGRDEHKMVETLASQAAIAIENARLFKDTQQIYYDTLKSLAQALEARDDYTKGHSERVAHIAHQIAVEMHLEQEEVRTIDNAALLHDIGKIGIRDDVLLAPRKLTFEELTIIKEHSAFGNAILMPLKFLGKIRECVRHHHERWDGGGYPDGLKGAEIPTASRIIAVADTYDAMTSNRPYRSSLSHDIAVQEIEAQSGRQFDPKVVTAFLKLARALGKEGLLGGMPSK